MGKSIFLVAIGIVVALVAVAKSKPLLFKVLSVVNPASIEFLEGR